MNKLTIDGHPVFVCDYSSSDRYWGELSKHLMQKYGNKYFTEHDEVEKILLDGFQHLIDKFRGIVMAQKNLSFFLYNFWLHEESIKLHRKMLNGLKLQEIDENEFATYRRILKLILEQGCDIDLEWGKELSAEMVMEYDKVLQDLLYTGIYIYRFADFVAFQKMVDCCHDIKFDESDVLTIDWQYHYGLTYDHIFTELRKDYEEGTVSVDSVSEFKSMIESCFGIDYNQATGIIFEIKNHHNPKEPTFQTIQPHVLSLNLQSISGTTVELAKKFYDGLSISKSNKLSIEDAVYRPYSMQRYMFRPILIYKVAGEERALVGWEKLAESIVVSSTNAFQWNAIHSDWEDIPCIKAKLNEMSNAHDKILEDKIEKIIRDRKLPYCRNIKSFKQKSGSNINIDNSNAGEIDFIIVHSEYMKIFVADAKYNRSRNEAVGYRADYTNFTKLHEPQLNKKVSWIKNNLKILQSHLKIEFGIKIKNIDDYDVEGIFFINTPTFYMFNGKFKALTLFRTPEFLDGNFEFPELIFSRKKDDEEHFMVVQHPYFSKPIVF